MTGFEQTILESEEVREAMGQLDAMETRLKREAEGMTTKTLPNKAPSANFEAERAGFERDLREATGMGASEWKSWTIIRESLNASLGDFSKGEGFEHAILRKLGSHTACMNPPIHPANIEASQRDLVIKHAELDQAFAVLRTTLQTLGKSGIQLVRYGYTTQGSYQRNNTPVTNINYGGYAKTISGNRWSDGVSLQLGDTSQPSYEMVEANADANFAKSFTQRYGIELDAAKMGGETLDPGANYLMTLYLYGLIRLMATYKQSLRHAQSELAIIPTRHAVASRINMALGSSLNQYHG